MVPACAGDVPTLETLAAAAILREHLPRLIDRVPGLGATQAQLRQQMADERLRDRAHTRERGEDAPEIREWTWA